MRYSRSEAIGKLLSGYRTYYNVTLYGQEKLPLRALCEYYEHNESYMVTRKANLWTSESEEFIYLYEVPVLTKDTVESCIKQAKEAGLELAHIGPGHMYTYITPIFICDSCEPEALKALKKCSIHKCFRFSFHGWMDVHTAVFQADSQQLDTNKSGKCLVKTLKKVLS